MHKPSIIEDVELCVISRSTGSGSIEKLIDIAAVMDVAPIFTGALNRVAANIINSTSSYIRV